MQTEAHEALVLKAICTSIKLDKPPLIPFGRQDIDSRCSLTSSSGNHSMKAGRVAYRETPRIKPHVRTLSPLARH